MSPGLTLPSVNSACHAVTPAHASVAASRSIQDSALQIDWVRRGQGLGLLPKRLLREKLPQGIALVDAPGLELSLRIVVLRSPHLHLLRKVADAVTGAVTATVGTD
ncbi:hypothetical protein NMG46_04015 [Mesorhizobium sp. LMG 17147]|uniref:hypothetical protein n=1 Tax=Mesorhizobium sp. LMG 17147 TaxID=2963091 RepID=UPI0020C95D03|nr:hypothetical protein [Mesorhizobium sp. LMG 17147]MCP9229416.1 hypothetical protein [Mesorhizobium sp. LMG 17147]